MKIKFVIKLYFLDLFLLICSKLANSKNNYLILKKPFVSNSSSSNIILALATLLMIVKRSFYKRNTSNGLMHGMLLIPMLLSTFKDVYFIELCFNSVFQNVFLLLYSQLEQARFRKSTLFVLLVAISCFSFKLTVFSMLRLFILGYVIKLLKNQITFGESAIISQIFALVLVSCYENFHRQNSKFTIGLFISLLSSFVRNQSFSIALFTFINISNIIMFFNTLF